MGLHPHHRDRSRLLLVPDVTTKPSVSIKTVYRVFEMVNGHLAEAVDRDHGWRLFNKDFDSIADFEKELANSDLSRGMYDRDDFSDRDLLLVPVVRRTVSGQ